MISKIWQAVGAIAALLFTTVPSQAEQCVPFARKTSGIELRGNAANWWQAAEGLYVRGLRPQAGAVMVFKATLQMKRGHVAVVRKVIDSRHVRIDHANWPRGRRMLNATAIDVSLNNDWSEVKVARNPTNLDWVRSNPILRFISTTPVQEASAQINAPVQASRQTIHHHSVSITFLPEPSVSVATPAKTTRERAVTTAPVAAQNSAPPPPRFAVPHPLSSAAGEGDHRFRPNQISLSVSVR